MLSFTRLSEYLASNVATTICKINLFGHQLLVYMFSNMNLCYNCRVELDFRFPVLDSTKFETCWILSRLYQRMKQQALQLKSSHFKMCLLWKRFSRRNIGGEYIGFRRYWPETMAQEDSLKVIRQLQVMNDSLTCITAKMKKLLLRYVGDFRQILLSEYSFN